MTRRACLEEEWFVDDQLAAMDGLCAACRSDFEAEIARFGNTPREALSNIYRMSRAIQVEHVLAGRPFARDCGPFEVLGVMRSVESMIEMAARNERMAG